MPARVPKVDRINVLLTGATGLLGGELLVQLSGRPEVATVACLVRGEVEKRQQRLRRVFELQGRAFPKRRVVAVAGDLLDVNLAGKLASRRELERTQVVIHAAANTSFLPQNTATIRETNIAGLGRLLRWAEQLSDLRCFVQVSTASLCGRDLTHRNLHEDESPNSSANHLVSYTASKADAEMLVRERLPADRLLVARPSILVGDSRGGVPRSDPVLWAVAAINRLRLVPVDAEARLDMVPVDYAARAIVELLFAVRQHDVYHVSSGREGATSARELATSLRSAFTKLPPFRFLPSESFAELASRIRRGSLDASRLGEVKVYLEYWSRAFGSKRRALALQTALGPYFRFMGLGQTFDNRRLLGDTGLTPPPTAHVYLRQSMEQLATIDVFRGALDP
jgi:thioester reductase-like protein